MASGSPTKLSRVLSRTKDFDGRHPLLDFKVYADEGEGPALEAMRQALTLNKDPAERMDSFRKIAHAQQTETPLWQQILGTVISRAVLRSKRESRIQSAMKDIGTRVLLMQADATYWARIQSMMRKDVGEQNDEFAELRQQYMTKIFEEDHNEFIEDDVFLALWNSVMKQDAHLLDEAKTLATQEQSRVQSQQADVVRRLLSSKDQHLKAFLRPLTNWQSDSDDLLLDQEEQHCLTKYIDNAFGLLIFLHVRADADPDFFFTFGPVGDLPLHVIYLLGASVLCADIVKKVYARTATISLPYISDIRLFTHNFVAEHLKRKEAQDFDKLYDRSLIKETLKRVDQSAQWARQAATQGWIPPPPSDMQSWSQVLDETEMRQYSEYLDTLGFFSGETVLHIAIANNHVKVVERLLSGDYKHKLNVRATGVFFAPPRLLPLKTATRRSVRQALCGKGGSEYGPPADGRWKTWGQEEEKQGRHRYQYRQLMKDSSLLQAWFGAGSALLSNEDSVFYGGELPFSFAASVGNIRIMQLLVQRARRDARESIRMPMKAYRQHSGGAKKGARTSVTNDAMVALSARLTKMLSKLVRDEERSLVAEIVDALMKDAGVRSEEEVWALTEADVERLPSLKILTSEAALKRIIRTHHQHPHHHHHLVPPPSSPEQTFAAADGMPSGIAAPQHTPRQSADTSRVPSSDQTSVPQLAPWVSLECTAATAKTTAPEYILPAGWETHLISGCAFGDGGLGEDGAAIRNEGTHAVDSYQNQLVYADSTAAVVVPEPKLQMVEGGRVRQLGQATRGGLGGKEALVDSLSGTRPHKIAKSVDEVEDDAALALINAQDSFGNTALHLAVWHNQTEAFDWIMANGGKESMETLSAYGLTPFTLAAYEGRVDMFRHILKKHLSMQLWTYGPISCFYRNLAQLDTFWLHKPAAKPTMWSTLRNLGASAKQSKQNPKAMSLRGAEKLQLGDGGVQEGVEHGVRDVLGLWNVMRETAKQEPSDGGREEKQHLERTAAMHENPNWRSALEIIILQRVEEIMQDSELKILIKTIIKKKWSQFAAGMHLWRRVVPYSLFVACFTTMLILRAKVLQDNRRADEEGLQHAKWDDKYPLATHVFEILVLAFVPVLALFGWDNLHVKINDLDINMDGKTSMSERVLFLYKNVHAFLDLLIVLSTCIVACLRAAGQEHYEVNGLCMTGVLVWCNVLSILVPYRFFGALVITIHKMLVGDVAKFLAIYVVLIMGFGLGLFVLIQNGTFPLDEAEQELVDCVNCNKHFGTLLLKLIWVSVGEAEQTEILNMASSPNLAYGIHLVYVILSLVLLLNLIIAMMGDTYNRQLADVEKEWFFPHAALVLKYEKRLSPEDRQKYRLGFSTSFANAQAKKPKDRELSAEEDDGAQFHWFQDLIGANSDESERVLNIRL